MFAFHRLYYGMRKLHAPSAAKPARWAPAIDLLQSSLYSVTVCTFSCPFVDIARLSCLATGSYSPCSIPWCLIGYGHDVHTWWYSQLVVQASMHWVTCSTQALVEKLIVCLATTCIDYLCLSMLLLWPDILLASPIANFGPQCSPPQIRVSRCRWLHRDVNWNWEMFENYVVCSVQ